MEPRSNTRRNCDYCVEKKVRCSGRIEGGACHYCARKDHVCIFSLKQKPGPKCNRHIGETPPFREESLGVDAISSAAAALSLSGSKPGLAAAMVWSQSAKGKRGGRGSTSRAFSAAEKSPFAPGSVGDGIGNRDHVMDEVEINSFLCGQLSGIASSVQFPWTKSVRDALEYDVVLSLCPVRAVSGDVHAR
ncbi:unnamed protein product [Ectocarpus sp. CCAP 1310/34]|nr:unnamed protein product [Ectocarpus sp. CCAP 1310/34]